MGRLRFVGAAVAAAFGMVALPLTAVTTMADQSPVSRYQHIFYIVEENHEFSQIIGNPSAPNLNALAASNGLATNYFGTSHPSEPNYVAAIGGSDYGIKDDGPYTTHTINQPSLADQLDAAGLSWKSYSQSMPFAGFLGTCSPCNSTDPSTLYASKHNGFLNFTGVQNSPAEQQKLVPDTQLTTDLASGSVPNFSFIVPDQCHDMHGTNDCPSDAVNVGVADTYAGQLVQQITSSSVWKKGLNAIVINFDEGNTSLGCCDANPGGGRVYAVVIKSHNVQAVQDATPFNHYSLLLTIEDAFRLGCLQNTCDAANVKPMTALFAAN